MITVTIAVMIAMIVAVAIPVPAMIMVDTPVPAFPIAGKKALAIVMRADPMGAFIWRARPISFVPSVVAPDRVPVTIYPEEIRTGSGRAHRNDAWWGRRADSDSDGYLTVGNEGARQQHKRK
jgi:hypothetical protein